MANRPGSQGGNGPGGPSGTRPGGGANPVGSSPPNKPKVIPEMV